MIRTRIIAANLSNKIKKLTQNNTIDSSFIITYYIFNMQCFKKFEMTKITKNPLFSSITAIKKFSLQLLHQFHKNNSHNSPSYLSFQCFFLKAFFLNSFLSDLFPGI